MEYTECLAARHSIRAEIGTCNHCIRYYSTLLEYINTPTIQFQTDKIEYIFHYLSWYLMHIVLSMISYICILYYLLQVSHVHNFTLFIVAHKLWFILLLGLWPRSLSHPDLGAMNVVSRSKTHISRIFICRSKLNASKLIPLGPHPFCVYVILACISHLSCFLIIICGIRTHLYIFCTYKLLLFWYCA